MAVTCVFEPSGGLGGSVGGGSSRSQQEVQVAQFYAGAAFGDEQRTVRRPSKMGQSKPYLLLHYPPAESGQTAAAAEEAKAAEAAGVTRAPEPVPPISVIHLEPDTTNCAPLEANCDSLNCSTFRTSQPAPTSDSSRSTTNEDNNCSNGKQVRRNRCWPGVDRGAKLDQETGPAGRRYQSLESIHSSRSSSCSSANDHPIAGASPSTSIPTSHRHHHHHHHHHHRHHRHHRRRNQAHQGRHKTVAGLPSAPSSGSSSASVLIGTRYVSPPRVADDYKQERRSHDSDNDNDNDCGQRPPIIDETDWQTIELNDVSNGRTNGKCNRDELGPGANLDPRRSFWSIDAAHAIRPSDGCRVPLANNFRFTRFASLVTSFKAKPLARGGELKSSSVNLDGKYPGDSARRDTSNGANRRGSKRASSGTQLNDDAAKQATSGAADQCKRKQSSDRAGLARKSVSSVGGASNSLGRRASKPQIGISEAPFMFAGILASMLGSLFFSISMLCIKLLPDDHGLVEKNKLVFFRGIVLMALCSGAILCSKSTFLIRRDEVLVNVLRCLFGFCGVYGSYVSLKYISMGDSTALVFSSPVWTSLLSHFLLNEPLKWIQLVALPASFVGIVLIAHPALLVNMELEAGATEKQPVIDWAEVLPAQVEQLPSANETTTAGPAVSALMPGLAVSPAPVINQTYAALLQTINSDLDISTNASEHFDFEHRWKGIVIALITSLFVSFVYIVLKFRKSTPIQTTTFWLGFATTCLSGIIMCFIGFGEWPQSWSMWSLILCSGVCSWFGQLLLQWALLYDDASVLSVIRTLDVAMTFTLSALFLEEQILWTSVLGAAIIAGVVVSMMLNSWLTSKLCPARHDTVGGVAELGFDDDHPAALKSSVGLDTVKALKYAEATGAGGQQELAGFQRDCEFQDKDQVAVVNGARRKSSSSVKQSKKDTEEGPNNSVAGPNSVQSSGAETAA